MSEKVNLPDIALKQAEVARFMGKITDNEKKLFDRASKLWESSIQSYRDLDELSVEIDFLVVAFEGLETDLDDLLTMRTAIRRFRECYNKLSDESLSYKQIKDVGNSLIAEYKESLKDEEIPWDFNDVHNVFLSIITQKREDDSNEWIKRLSEKILSIETMGVSDANQLLQQFQVAPIYLSEAQKAQITSLRAKIEKRLSNLSVEWLLEKFKELDDNERQAFLTKIKQILR